MHKQISKQLTKLKENLTPLTYSKPLMLSVLVIGVMAWVCAGYLTVVESRASEPETQEVTGESEEEMARNIVYEDGAYNTYIGARYLPEYRGDWYLANDYEPLSIVYYQGSTYMSRKFVPQNTDLFDTEYWLLAAKYNAQIEFIRVKMEELITQMTDYLTLLQELRDEVDTRLYAMDLRLDGMAANITTMQDEINDLLDKLNAMQGDIDDIHIRLGQISGELSEIQSSITNLQTQITNTSNRIDSIVTISDIAPNSHRLYVAKSGARFTTINAAIDYARTYCTKTNRVTIYIGSGTYDEAIELSDNVGIDMVGAGAGATVITSQAAYPAASLHTTGLGTFTGITFQIRGTSNSYALHFETNNNKGIGGETSFYNCEFVSTVSGRQAVGVGLGQNCTVAFYGCLFKSNGAEALYAHNNAYENTANQTLIVKNCTLMGQRDNVCFLLDDAAYPYGYTTSPMLLIASDNNMVWGGLLYRKNSTLHYKYVPSGEPNITLGLGNSLLKTPGLDPYSGRIVYGAYVQKSGNAIYGTSVYKYSAPFVHADLYDWTINEIAVPGLGGITASCSIEGVTNTAINISDTTATGAGYTLSVSLIGTPRY